MDIHVQIGRRHLLVLAVLAAAVIGGVAYAAIPDAGGVLTACRLSSNGSLRLIDPSLASGPLSRCTPNETQVQWNEQGRPGANGRDGTSPTVAQLAAGDSHCPAGGASITDAAGNVAYACSGADGRQGQPGRDGAPFDGTFTSPNGRFSLTVSDGGVTIIGPDSSLSLPAAGGIRILAGSLETRANDSNTVISHDETTTVGNDRTMSIGHNRTEQVGNDESISVGRDRAASVQGDETISVGKSRTANIGRDELLSIGRNHLEEVASTLTMHAGGSANIAGSVLSLGSTSGCTPAARVGDQVSATAILTGSATVCIGG